MQIYDTGALAPHHANSFKSDHPRFPAGYVKPVIPALLSRERLQRLVAAMVD
jgi:hypothetical protein